MRTLALRCSALSIIAAAAMLVGCGGSQPPSVPGGMPQSLTRTVCPQVVGKPRCMVLLSDKVRPPCSPTLTCGWTPAQLETAYGLTSALGNGSGTNIAFIEVGDLVNASSDLSTYRGDYGLGTGNLTKYNEYGQQSNYPPSCQNYGWCIASDLDIDMVSAACPKCNIFLIESKDGISDFETAEAEAVTLGATILSNSWSCPGSYDCGDPTFPNYFDTPGITYLGAAGVGYGDPYGNVGAPAALASVIAVGGTQLVLSGSKYRETLWPDSGGGGCASPSEVGGSGIPKPSWQKDPDCKYRTVVDVSAEAGCAPGVAAYSSIYGGWTEVCGTSVSTPFTAGVIALAGNADKLGAGKTFWTFGSKEQQEYFHHPSGSGERGCGNYLCGDGRYKKHYSGPGGWGSPNGTKGY